LGGRGHGIVPWMGSLPLQLLVSVRVAEGWTSGNALGALFLLTVVLAAVVALRVIRRR
jgi:hypothetical protein